MVVVESLRVQKTPTWSARAGAKKIHGPTAVAPENKYKIPSEDRDLMDGAKGIRLNVFVSVSSMPMGVSRFAGAKKTLPSNEAAPQ